LDCFACELSTQWCMDPVPGTCFSEGMRCDEDSDCCALSPDNHPNKVSECWNDRCRVDVSGSDGVACSEVESGPGYCPNLATCETEFGGDGEFCCWSGYYLCENSGDCCGSWACNDLAEPGPWGRCEPGVE
jgi:hypothetical protein